MCTSMCCILLSPGQWIYICVCLLPGHTKIGYALYFYTYSSWKGRAVYMEDLYVMPEFRGTVSNAFGCNGPLKAIETDKRKCNCDGF